MKPTATFFVLLLLLAVTIAVLGCSSAIAPVPPMFVGVVSDPPAHYRPQRPTWPTGRRVVYRSVQHMEMILEDHGPTTESATVMLALESVSETAHGLRRVQIAVDRKRLGSALFTAAGELTDFIAESSEAEPALPTIRAVISHAGAETYFSSTLVKGERNTMRIKVKDFLLGPVAALLEQRFNDEWMAEYELEGYRIVAGRRAAEIHTVIKDVLRGEARVALSPKVTATVTSLRGTTREYMDLSTGMSLAKYEVIDTSGIVQGKHWRARAITSTQIDMVASRL